MQRAICALKESRKAILEELQSMGVMHIITTDEEEGVEKIDTLQSMMLFDKNAQTCSNAIEILNKYAPQKKGLLESLNGKDLAEYSEYRRMEIQRESILVKAQKIINLEKEKADKRAKEALDIIKELDNMKICSCIADKVSNISGTYGTFNKVFDKIIIQRTGAAREIFIQKLDKGRVVNCGSAVDSCIIMVKNEAFVAHNSSGKYL